MLRSAHASCGHEGHRRLRPQCSESSSFLAPPGKTSVIRNGGLERIVKRIWVSACPGVEDGLSWHRQEEL